LVKWQVKPRALFLSQSRAAALVNEVGRGTVARNEVFQLLSPSDDDHDSDDDDGVGVDVAVSAELAGVDFRYPSRPRHRLLHRFSLEVPPGNTVALAGASGGGKSTVLALLQRWYSPEKGVVRVGGADVGHMSRSRRAQLMGVVSQEPVLFNVSLAENIRTGRTDITDAQVLLPPWPTLDFANP
jgi:ABC-type multidrug transport system fused ATPase/permease subunit